MYNRVWRRVYGKPRHGRSDVTDVRVRVEMCIPSLDCYVRKRRLKYLTRMCKLDLPPLMALLQAQGRLQQAMPWSKLVITDFNVLRSFLPRILGGLPPPEVTAEPYWELLRDFPNEWREIVDQYFTPYDDAAEPIAAESNVHSHANQHVCDICNSVAFRTQKALLQHKRMKHKCMSRICDLVPDISVCPVCGTDFIERPRLISHLSDARVRSRKRGTSCHDVFLKSMPPPLSAVEKARLRAKSAADLKKARRSGHTHVMASCPSRTDKKRSLPTCAQADAEHQPKRRRRLRFKQPSAALFI
eukprot:822141-Karenia_brevis.AAC.1